MDTCKQGLEELTHNGHVVKSTSVTDRWSDVAQTVPPYCS